MQKTLTNLPLAIAVYAITTCATPTGVWAQNAEPDVEDLRMYLYCDQLSAARMLNFDEASVCMSAYQRIKLSFVPGVELSDYEQLAAEERAAINLQGYAGFTLWSELNSDLIQGIRDELQVELFPSLEGL